MSQTETETNLRVYLDQFLTALAMRMVTRATP